MYRKTVVEKWWSIAALFLAGTLLAATTQVSGLSPSSFVDTEVMTNVAFSAGASEVRRFCLAIELDASVSNNVEVAFGYDRDEDGVLDRSEVDLKVGWDAGEWFYRDRRAGIERHVARGDGRRRLDWLLRLDEYRVPVALAASDADGAVFTGTVYYGTVPATMFDTTWNLMRVTVRGRSDPAELVSTNPDGWGFRVILR